MSESNWSQVYVLYHLDHKFYFHWFKISFWTKENNKISHQTKISHHTVLHVLLYLWWVAICFKGLLQVGYFSVASVFLHKAHNLYKDTITQRAKYPTCNIQFFEGNDNQPWRNPRHWTCLTYIKGFSEKIEQVIRPSNIRAGFKTKTTIPQKVKFMKLKGEPNKDETKGIIYMYKVPCEDGAVYVGETEGNLHRRLQEA